MDMDLWPKTKFETDLVTPVSILRRQAALLGEKTQQLVTADVATEASGGTYVTHNFRLVVPSLDNYKFLLFKVMHKVDNLYPLEAYFEGNTVHILMQEDFVNWLKRTLSSESTLKRIDSLMAQAKE
jgi:hypothetical protein